MTFLKTFVTSPPISDPSVSPLRSALFCAVLSLASLLISILSRLRPNRADSRVLDPVKVYICACHDLLLPIVVSSDDRSVIQSGHHLSLVPLGRRYDICYRQGSSDVKRCNTFIAVSIFFWYNMKFRQKAINVAASDVAVLAHKHVVLEVCRAAGVAVVLRLVQVVRIFNFV